MEGGGQTRRRKGGEMAAKAIVNIANPESMARCIAFSDSLWYYREKAKEAYYEAYI